MKNKNWFAVLKCVDVYEKIDTHKFVKGNYYLVFHGHLIDGYGKATYGSYCGIEDLEGAFYADFQIIISSSSSMPRTFPRQ
ncbi:MAG: hypothetical protein ACI4I9_08860 [Porcipelethomonas sp.]